MFHTPEPLKRIFKAVFYKIALKNQNIKILKPFWMFGGHSFNENPPYFADPDFSYAFSEFHVNNIHDLAKNDLFFDDV